MHIGNARPSPFPPECRASGCPSGPSHEVILIASGSEISVALDAHERLLTEGIRSRVVSMRSRDIFEHQTQQYRDSVLPHHIEQASTFGWERYIGPSGRVIE